MVDEITGESQSEEEVMEQLARLASTATVPEEKQNVHSFLFNVATADDTTKLGNLKEEEVGIPTLSSRTLKELALYCKDIADEKEWADYFEKRSEILTSTSLSKEAKLLELAVVNRREVADVTRQRKVNKGWFGKRPQSPTEEI